MKEQEIINIILPVLDELGLELVELQYSGSGNKSLLRIFVDCEGGVSLKQCTEASRAISDILDRKDPIQSRYTLEVSSPGLDRPLKTKRDFSRNVGRLVKIKYSDGDQNRRVTGRIKSADSSGIELEQDQETIRVEYDAIELAKLKIEF